MPLIIFSLIDGISNLTDVTRLSRIGGKTIAFYLSTTIIAVTIGLCLVNLIKPGKFMSPEKRDELREAYAADMDTRIVSAHGVKDVTPLKPLVDVVPENFLGSAADNTNMLQVIFFAILFGIAMILSDQERIKSVKSFFDGANSEILKIVDLIMRLAPVAVFALLASLNIDTELIKALGVYSLNVVIGLAVMVFIAYPSILKLFTRVKYVSFIKGILPAQMLAFSTSSSAATLPVTME